MGFFIDKHNRRKSPVVLAAFCAALLDLAVFGVLYALLIDPLYHYLPLGGGTAASFVHSIVIACIGTALCCLLFLLPDKRVAPYGFAGLAVVMCMFYIAAAMLEPAAQAVIVQFVSMFGLAPVVVSNAVAWPLYSKLKRDHPAPNHKKTFREEIREVIAEEKSRQKNRAAQPEKNAACPAEESIFPPEVGRAPSARNLTEEAMLFYEDGEKSDN